MDDKIVNQQKAMLVKLDALISEAEGLEQYIESNKKDAALAVYRWGIVADEASAQLKNIEEAFDDTSLSSARIAFDMARPGMWLKYSTNVRRFKQITGQEIYESHPQQSE